MGVNVHQPSQAVLASRTFHLVGIVDVMAITMPSLCPRGGQLLDHQGSHQKEVTKHDLLEVSKKVLMLNAVKPH